MFDFEKHLKLFIDGKFDLLAKEYDENAEYFDATANQRMRGRDEIMKILQTWKRAFPDIRYTIKDTLAAGDKVFVELEWEGTHKGPFVGPLGTIEATGKRGVLPAALFYMLKGDKVVALHHYFDVMTILTQIGVVQRPVVGAPPVETQPVVH